LPVVLGGALLPGASDPPLRRAYADIDVVGHANQRRRITELLARLGYEADTVFNATHGARRLFFWDKANGRQLDVFLDKVEMCHVIDLGRRLDVPGPALAPADLLLLKLQVVETNEKDPPGAYWRRADAACRRLMGGIQL
jgi:hypothetical protein